MAYETDLLYETNERGERELVRSIESTRKAYIRFTNLTSRPLNVWWRDFRGARRHYVRMKPRQFFDINTFLTHPWEFSDAATNEFFVINNRIVFRAPANVGDMRYRTNWNITVPMRTLRDTALLAIASRLRTHEIVVTLDLPKFLQDDLRDLTIKLKTGDERVTT